MEVKNKKKVIALLLSGIFVPSAYAELYFPSEMLSLHGGDAVDISHFSADGRQLPGTYKVDLYINNNFVLSKLVNFSASKSSRDDTGLMACLNREDFTRAGVKVELYPELLKLSNDECVDIAAFIPESYTTFDFTNMRVNISAPQASVYKQARGYVDPSLWDDGINAGLLNYNLTGNSDVSGTRKSENLYVNLKSGLNIGPWRLRDNRVWSSYHTKTASQREWQRINTYLSRSIAPLRSTLVVGENTTSGDIFNSLGFTGVQLASDENMYPDSMRGFAPIVRGIAESNAEVSIRQNGYNIYRTNVSPGPFEIDDLMSMYTSGDLEVTIRESNGTVRVFTVPFSPLPTMLREGRTKYNLTAGKLRTSSDQIDTPAFAQGTLVRGLASGMTAYGGLQVSGDYFAGQAGMGIDLGAYGGLSADITHAESTLQDGVHYSGQSARLLYAHAFNPTGTTFRLTGYHYSTREFHTLEETAYKSMIGRRNSGQDRDKYGNVIVDRGIDYYNLHNSRKARFEASVSQQLGEYGSLYLTGVKQTYWNSTDGNTSLQMGYSGSYNSVSFTLGYNYTDNKNRDGVSYHDHRVNLSMSVPLDRIFGSIPKDNLVYATFNASKDNNGSISQQTGLSGSLLEDKNLSWNVSQGYAKSNNGVRSQGGQGSAGLRYRGQYGEADIGYSHGNDYQRFSYGTAGSAILHSGGLTLGQQIGDSSVLLSTQGKSGIGIQGEKGIKTDWQGYAIRPYATAYRENRVSIDAESLDDRTEVESSTLRVIPTKGAIVKADFKVQRGQRVLLNLTHNGKPLPFGAIVSSSAGSSIVGDEGQVFLSGLSDKGTVRARWGEKASQNCVAEYSLDELQKAASIARINSICK